MVADKGLNVKQNVRKWLCVCECGKEQEVSDSHLKRGASTRCIQCSGKRNSDDALNRNFGMYSGDRRMVHVKVATEMLYETQKKICPICAKPLPELRRCAWDHDHKTGEGRDLLHGGCNVFLGFIECDPETLNRVIQYCKRYGIIKA